MKPNLRFLTLLTSGLIILLSSLVTPSLALAATNATCKASNFISPKNTVTFKPYDNIVLKLTLKASSKYIFKIIGPQNSNFEYTLPAIKKSTTELTLLAPPMPLRVFEKYSTTNKIPIVLELIEQTTKGSCTVSRSPLAIDMNLKINYPLGLLTQVLSKISSRWGTVAPIQNQDWNKDDIMLSDYYAKIVLEKLMGKALLPIKASYLVKNPQSSQQSAEQVNAKNMDTLVSDFNSELGKMTDHLANKSKQIGSSLQNVGLIIGTTAIVGGTFLNSPTLLAVGTASAIAVMVGASYGTVQGMIFEDAESKYGSLSKADQKTFYNQVEAAMKEFADKTSAQVQQYFDKLMATREISNSLPYDVYQLAKETSENAGDLKSSYNQKPLPNPIPTPTPNPKPPIDNNNNPKSLSIVGTWYAQYFGDNKLPYTDERSASKNTLISYYFTFNADGSWCESRTGNSLVTTISAEGVTTVKLTPYSSNNCTSNPSWVFNFDPKTTSQMIYWDNSGGSTASCYFPITWLKDHWEMNLCNLQIKAVRY